MQADFSARLSQLIAALILREGGYVDDPDDRGGPTNYGITLATLHAWRGTPVSAADVAALTVGEASAIYTSEYFTKPGFDAVADPILQEFLFDFGVNSGPRAATMALQTVLLQAGLYAGKIDGSFGPLSRAAIAKVTNHAALFFAVKCERYEFLLRDVGQRPADAKYAAGWANRLDGFSEPVA
jgi:type VI secretion system secreted protein VgrG